MRLFMFAAVFAILVHAIVAATWGENPTPGLTDPPIGPFPCGMPSAWWWRRFRSGRWSIDKNVVLLVGLALIAISLWSPRKPISASRGPSLPHLWNRHRPRPARDVHHASCASKPDLRLNGSGA